MLRPLGADSERGRALAEDNLGIDEFGTEEETARTSERPGNKDEEAGLFAKIGQAVTRPFRAFRPAELLAPKPVATVIVAALVVWLLAANTAPVRVVLFFWTVDVPKALAFVIDVALGAVLMWLWMRGRGHRKLAEGEGNK